MNKKKIVSALSAIALIAATGSRAITPVHATEYTTLGGTATFASYIVMPKEAYAPKETIAYTISSYDNDATLMEGAPKIPDVEFALNQTSYDTIQSMDPDLNEKKQTTEGTDDKDTVSLATDGSEKYVRAAVSVNFTGVTFKSVGTYKFLIQQTAGSDPAMTYDTTPMIMEVYVVYNTAAGATSGLTITGYAMYKATAVTTTAGTTYTINDGTNGTTNTKADGFVNTYSVKSLEVAKLVTGNQGSHDEYFPFTVTITNAQKGMIYDVDISGAQALTTINGLSTTAHTNRTFIKADETTGIATETFWLHNNQHITIKNVPVGSSYTINEDPDKLSDEKYTATAVVTGDTVDGKNVQPETTTAGKVLVHGTFTYTKDDNSYETATFNADGTMTRYHSDTNVTETDYTWKQTSATTLAMIQGDDVTTWDATIDMAANTVVVWPKIGWTYKAVTTGDIPEYNENGVWESGVANPTTMNASTLVVKDGYIKKDTVVTYTNNKVGAIPTGIITTTVPYAVVVLAGFFGLLIFARKRRHAEEE